MSEFETATVIAPEPAPEENLPVSVPAAEQADELLVEEVSIDGMCGVY